MQRTNYTGLITEQYIGQTVTVNGWVHRRRDLGGLIFLDLRDREGLVQVVIEPESPCFEDASLVKHEYVLNITGVVRQRPNPNKEIRTGQVEIVATNI
ncbi:MAG: aspartate--tRNA ligase, partial [Burkholderiales bacterium]|nr:aspartate--tRNA ligase [Burkholderiales bacterium]